MINFDYDRLFQNVDEELREFHLGLIKKINEGIRTIKESQCRIAMEVAVNEFPWETESYYDGVIIIGSADWGPLYLGVGEHSYKWGVSTDEKPLELFLTTHFEGVDISGEYSPSVLEEIYHVGFIPLNDKGLVKTIVYEILCTEIEEL